MDYKYVDDDFRRGVAVNNLQTAEREHAGTALGLDMANRMIAKCDEGEVKEQYREQARQLEARASSLEAQIKAWNEVLDSIPTIVSQELPLDKKGK